MEMAGGYSYTSDELNSKLSLNGVDIVRDSNTIDDLINGCYTFIKKRNGSWCSNS